MGQESVRKEGPLRSRPDSNRPLQGPHTVAHSGGASDSLKLSNVEREVIAAIQSIRRSDNQIIQELLHDDPARLVHHLILSTHGHVGLRFWCIAHELAVETRTLQRVFRRAFKMSMRQFQMKVRLAYAKDLLMANPPEKMSVIAALLGYRAMSGFIRFFREHMKKSPSEWRHEQQSKVVARTADSSKPT